MSATETSDALCHVFDTCQITALLCIIWPESFHVKIHTTFSGLQTVKLPVVALKSNFHNWINALIRNIIDSHSFVFFHNFENINSLAKF